MQVVFPGHPHTPDLCSESLSLLHGVLYNPTLFETSLPPLCTMVPVEIKPLNMVTYSSDQKKVPVPFACNDRSTVWASPFRPTQSVRTTVADSAIIAAWGKRWNL